MWWKKIEAISCWVHFIVCYVLGKGESLLRNIIMILSEAGDAKLLSHIHL